MKFFFSFNNFKILKIEHKGRLHGKYWKRLAYLMIGWLKQNFDSTFTYQTLKVGQIKVGLKCYLDKRITSYRNFLL